MANTDVVSVRSVLKTTNRSLIRVLAQTRYRFATMGAVAVLLALLTLFLATQAYSVSSELFRGIVETNSTTVDASERALQYIAQASQAAADYAMLTSDTPLFEQAQNNIFRNFSSFRDEMSRLDANLQTDDERSAFIVADTMTYSRFWRHVSNLVAQRTNDAVARREYLESDNHVRSWINPALEELETLNFDQMVRAGESAGGIIFGQIVLFAIVAANLVLLLTHLSFQLRQKVRRYLTPGIDIAMILSYVTFWVILGNLLNAPGQINTMIQSAYRSVSASSRVLVDANLANRAESSVLIDTDKFQIWNERFDEAIQHIELRICGRPGCSETTFLQGTGRFNIQVALNAQQISRENSDAIDNIIPLVANVTFNGEAEELEAARLAFRDYVNTNVELRKLIEVGDLEGAIAFNTGMDIGNSQEVFERFAAAMTDLSKINRGVFDQIWQTERPTLQTNQLIFGFIGYLAIAILVIIGVSHRIREL